MGGVPSHIQQPPSTSVGENALCEVDACVTVGGGIAIKNMEKSESIGLINSVSEDQAVITRGNTEDAVDDDDEDNDIDEEEELFQEFTEKSLVVRHRSAIDKARRQSKGESSGSSGSSESTFGAAFLKLTATISEKLGKSSSVDENFIISNSSESDSDSHEVFGEKERQSQALHPSICADKVLISSAGSEQPAPEPSPLSHAATPGKPPSAGKSPVSPLPSLNLGSLGSSMTPSPPPQGSTMLFSPSPRAPTYKSNAGDTGDSGEQGSNERREENDNVSDTQGFRRRTNSRDVGSRCRSDSLGGGSSTPSHLLGLTPRARQLLLDNPQSGPGAASAAALSDFGGSTPRTRAMRLLPLGDTSDTSMTPRTRGKRLDSLDDPSLLPQQRRPSLKEKLTSIGQALLPSSRDMTGGNETESDFDGGNSGIQRKKSSPQILKTDSQDSRGEGSGKKKLGSIGSFGANPDEADPKKKTSFEKNSFNASADDNDMSVKGRRRSGSIKTALGVVSAALGITPKERTPSEQQHPITNSTTYQTNCQILLRHTEARQKFAQYIKRKQWLPELFAVQTQTESSKNSPSLYSNPDVVQFNKFIAAAPSMSCRSGLSPAGPHSPKKELVVTPTSAAKARPALQKRSSQPIQTTVPIESPIQFRSRSKSVFETEKQFTRDMMTLRSLKFKETNDPDLYAFQQPSGPTSLFNSEQMRAMVVAILFPLFMETEDYRLLNINVRNLHRRGSSFGFSEAESDTGGLMRRRSSKNVTVQSFQTDGFDLSPASRSNSVDMAANSSAVEQRSRQGSVDGAANFRARLFGDLGSVAENMTALDVADVSTTAVAARGQVSGISISTQSSFNSEGTDSSSSISRQVSSEYMSIKSMSGTQPNSPMVGLSSTKKLALDIAIAAGMAAAENQKPKKVTQETKRLREMVQSVVGAVQAADLERIMMDGSWLTTVLSALDEVPLALSVADTRREGLVDSTTNASLGYPTVYVNKRFEENFHCKRDDVIGHGCLLHQHDDPTGAHMRFILEGISEERLVKVVVNSMRRDEEEFLNLLTIQPVFNLSQQHTFLCLGGYEANREDASMKDINKIDDTISMVCSLLQHCTDSTVPTAEELTS